MATVTLGNIKLNWKGAYNAGTAYAIDDVVSYNGSSYIAKTATTGNLPTVTANWDLMSQAGTNGTNGTDLTTTLTTQGDTLYRDGSGLQRLAKGTAGYYLKQGTNHPEWSAVASDYVKIKELNGSNVSSMELVHGANDVVFDGTYSQYLLKIMDFYEPTSGAELRLRISTDSGSSWKTSGYVGTRWRFYYTNTSNNSDIENKTDVIWQWWYQQGGDTASQSRSFGEVYLSNPSLGSYPHAFGEYSGAEGNQIIVGSMSGKYQSGGAYNGLQLTKSNGANFYAKVILYGIK